MEKDFGEDQSEIQDFFEGRSVFITGAAGYLGGVFLEQILRLCPGIVHIFILLRGKRGYSPEMRKDYILNKPIFWKVKEENPKAIEKVVSVAGDITEDDLGLSSADIERLKENVSVVFHCAAVISFRKTFKFTVMNNVVGTDNIVQLCKKLPKIAAFIYTSTAFANTYRHTVFEELTKMPFSPKTLAEKARDGDENFLNYIQKKYSTKWKNLYLFTKSVAENLIVEEAGNIPVAIVKPSVISHVWKNGSLPGYIEKGTVFAHVTAGVILGFLHVLPLDKNKRSETIPPDIVANTLIVGAWISATKRVDKVLIINCISSHKAPMTWGTMFQKTKEKFYTCLSPYTLRVPDNISITNLRVYLLLSFLLHHIPAYFLDFYLRRKGENPKLLKGYQMLDLALTDVGFFLTHDYEFNADNFESLKSFQNRRDTELFSTEIATYDPTSALPCLGVNKLFQFKNDDPILKMKQVALAERALIYTNIYKFFLMGFSAWLIWFLLKNISSILM